MPINLEVHRTNVSEKGYLQMFLSTSYTWRCSLTGLVLHHIYLWMVYVHVVL